jgi:hypothetical protein
MTGRGEGSMAGRQADRKAGRQAYDVLLVIII